MTDSTAPHTERALPARLNSIDFLRGSAALAVVSYHAVVFRMQPAATSALWFNLICAVLKVGFIGVPLFFVISGFCIHQRWARQMATTGQADLSFGRFWKRRLHRLYPPYLVVLCASMTMVLGLYLLHKPSYHLDFYPQPHGRWMALDFLAHLTMLHGLFRAFDYGGGNEPFWTLAREEYFYLMYFAVLAWRRARGLPLTLAMVFALGIVVPWGAPPLLHLLGMDTARVAALTYPVNNVNSALVLWIQWCLGMAAAEAYYGLIALPNWCRSGWMAVVWVALGCLNNAYAGRFLSPLWLSPLLWGMTFFTLLNYCVGLERDGRWPDWRWVRTITAVGLFSYSLYLVHALLFDVTDTVISKASIRLGLAQSPAYWLFGSACMVLASVGAAWVFFGLVERRFIHTAAATAAAPPRPEPREAPYSVLAAEPPAS